MARPIEPLPLRSHLGLLPASSRYGLLLRASPSLPPNKEWYTRGSSEAEADPIPPEFEPAMHECGPECDGACVAREYRWRARFGNPHTCFGRLQTAFEARIREGEGEREGQPPQWTRASWLAQLVVFYPPVLERLVELMDLQTLLGLMSSCAFLRRYLLNYPPAWTHISLDVRRRGVRLQREAALSLDAQRGSKHGAWAGSRLRHTHGAMRLAGSPEASLLSSLPLAGLRRLDLDGSPAAGSRAFNDVLRATRSTLEVLSVRFCSSVSILDVQKILTSCAVGSGEDEDEDDDYEEEEEPDNELGYRFVRRPDCALKKLHIWGIGQAHAYPRACRTHKTPPLSADSLKPALPVEIDRRFMARQAKTGAAIALDHRGALINGMFYIPSSIRKQRRECPWDPPNIHTTGRMLVVARQLGVVTDFEDCDARGDGGGCWNHNLVVTTRDWKFGVPGLRTARRCSSCGLRRNETMCRDCEEHRTCFGCKKMACRDCDPEFCFVDSRQCSRCSDEGRFYCRECRDATAEALSELAAAKGLRGGESCPGGVGLHGGGGGS